MNDVEMIITPRRDKNDPKLPASGLLLINPAEANAGLKLAKKMGGQEHFLFNSRLMLVPENESPESFFIAGPAVGAPMAVMTLEKLIALGARRIIAYGWCGSLSDTVKIGDVLLPTWAKSDEGTSGHYPVKSRPESLATTRKLLTGKLTALGQTVHCGPVWTTDAPYRESRQKIKSLGSQGILGVDMEFSALCTVAAFRNIEITAVLLVSDEIFHEEWKPGFRTKGFKKKSREILNCLVDFCQKS